MIPIGSIIGFTYTPVALPTVPTVAPFYVIAKLVNYLPATIASSIKFMSIYSYEGFPVGIHTIIARPDAVILYDNETEFLNANPEYAI